MATPLDLEKIITAGEKLGYKGQELKWNEMKFISSYSTNYKEFHGILLKKSHVCGGVYWKA